ncbi:hypothetical protein ACE4V3_02730 [Borrelia recurrentis]|uniref:Uncharacterized conserved protein n=1 Tax=Borrelia recurrentis (strain A1) TaxID=412418 RepID=B5RRC6_BORRA|nr:hypothetical protein [Borrelia recurrentis]ACH94560.1 uncharacterized conserved protein [Borrelia recurrentis A1]
MIIIFLFLFSISNLYSFLEFGKDEKFYLIDDFGEIKNDTLNIGIKLRALDTHFSIFSNNYKVLYSKNKINEYDKSVLIIFDKDLNFNLEFFGDFIYKDDKVFLMDNKNFDIVVVDQYNRQIINPLFVIKNRNNLNIISSFFVSELFLKSKDNIVFLLKENVDLDLELGNYTLVLNFLKRDVAKESRILTGIYYFEVLLNNNSVFRIDFQSIYLNGNSYVVSGNKNYNLNVFDLKKNNGSIKIDNLEFTNGSNEIKIKYGDVYNVENSLTYRFTLNG